MMTLTVNAGTPRKSVRCFAVVTAMCLFGFASERVQAVPMTYTINATGTGSLGGTAFSDSDFVITAVADTNNIESSDSGFGSIFIVINSNINISVTGIGNGDFTNETQSVSNQGYNVAGFGDNGECLAILYVENPIFGSYDLSSPIGPISGSPVYNFFDNASFPTTAGSFVLTDVSNSSFTAVVVPEPTTFLLAALALLANRRRLRA